MYLSREEQDKLYLEIKDKFDYKNFDYIKSFVAKTSFEERNNFRDDVWIVVAGHLTFVDELIVFYKGLKNVLVVVDSKEDITKVKKLEKNNIKYIISQTPSSCGFGNINLQAVSSLDSMEYLKKQGVKHAIRMRSDQLIVQMHDFINTHKFDKIGSICICLNTPQHNSHDNFFGFIDKLCIENNIPKNVSCNFNTNYILDYCLTGPVEHLIEMFQYKEEEQFYAPAEHKLLLTYLHRTNKTLTNDIDFLRDNFVFFYNTLKENNIDFLSLKQNYHNWTVAIGIQPWLYTV